MCIMKFLSFLNVYLSYEYTSMKITPPSYMVLQFCCCDTTNKYMDLWTLTLIQKEFLVLLAIFQ
jgi:hypothetical protein